jgi:hypothetical protein
MMRLYQSLAEYDVQQQGQLYIIGDKIELDRFDLAED